MFFEEAQIAPSMYFTKHGFILGFLLLATGCWSLASGSWLLVSGSASSKKQAASSQQPA